MLIACGRCDIQDLSERNSLEDLAILKAILVPIPRRIILRTNHQPPPLLRAPKNRFHNINQFLLILQHPIQLIIVSSSKIAHHVFIAEEEHDGHWVVEFVHLLEVGHLVEVAEVDDGEVFDALGDAVEHFVLAHAVGVPVAAEADHDEAVFFGHDGLVNVPAGGEMREDDGAHGGCVSFGDSVRSVKLANCDVFQCVSLCEGWGD